MPLTSILSVQVRPDRFAQYQELVRNLAASAVEQKDAFCWTAHQTAVGELGTLYFVSEEPDFAGLAARGNTQELMHRVLGEDEGANVLASMLECTISQQMTISLDRPELSYPPEQTDRIFPSAVVTQIRARPGGQEALEELLRKIAEAIPKIGDSSRIIAYQVMVGMLAEYWTVRPLEDLSELDEQLPPAELLNQAFGAAEGGLIFRTGLEAIEEVKRQIVVYRQDLSNPG
jgi:hypothetical protein